MDRDEQFEVFLAGYKAAVEDGQLNGMPRMGNAREAFVRWMAAQETDPLF